MDIEQFYDADPRRRESEEIEFGREWSDANGLRTELSWVATTGELYAMAEPSEPVFMDPVGDTRVPDLPTELVTVDILGVIPDRARVDLLLAGWEGEMEAQQHPVGARPDQRELIAASYPAAARSTADARSVGSAKPSSTSASYADA